MSPNKLDRYQILASLGSGEYKETYLAIDLASPTQNKVVVKCWQTITQHDNQIIAKLFLKEALSLQELSANFSQIPTLYDYFFQDNQYYLVEEYIAGKNLAQLNVISPQQCLVLLSSLLKALQNIHHQNMIHRNLKPENIIIRASDQLPVLIDFGTVKEAIGGFSASAQEFTAPEQNQGRAIFSSDLYALSLTMIYAMTGKTPLELPCNQTTRELEWQKLVPNLDDNLARVLTKASQIERSHRYATSEQMYRDLEQSVMATEQPVEKEQKKTIPVKQIANNVSLPRQKFPSQTTSNSHTNNWQIIIVIPLLLGFSVGFLIAHNQMQSDQSNQGEQNSSQTDFSFPLEWQPSCGDEGSSGIGEWWAVKGPKSALELIRDEYCGDAFLFSKIGEIQVASFRSQDKAQSFANHLNQATGYDFWVKKSQ